MNTRRGPDGTLGFTLIELLIAISILGLIATAVVALTITSLRTTRETQERLNDTGAYMITSGYFGPDVAAATRVVANNQPDLPRGNAQPGCGPTDEALVVQLTGPTYTDMDSSKQVTVSYTLADDGRTMTRFSCVAPDTPDPMTELVMAEGLDPARPPTLTCRNGDNTPPVNCNADSPGLITMTLTTAGGQKESIDAVRRTTS